MSTPQDPLAEVVARLVEWGRWSRETTDRLGIPSESCISRMMDQAKVFPAKERKRAARPTAKGHQPVIMTAPTVKSAPADVMAIDRIVAKAPAAYQKPLKRRYIYNQPDRHAARELRMTLGAYAGYAKGAEKYVAQCLLLL